MLDSIRGPEHQRRGHPLPAAGAAGWAPGGRSWKQRWVYHETNEVSAPWALHVLRVYKKVVVWLGLFGNLVNIRYIPKTTDSFHPVSACSQRGCRHVWDPEKQKLNGGYIYIELNWIYFCGSQSFMYTVRHCQLGEASRNMLY